MELICWDDLHTPIEQILKDADLAYPDTLLVACTRKTHEFLVNQRLPVWKLLFVFDESMRDGRVVERRRLPSLKPK
jgi:hypothetical protein